MSMKFIVSTTALLRNLQTVNGVVSPNTVLPILEDFLFVVEKNKLTISGTDLETSITTWMDIESKSEGNLIDFSSTVTSLEIIKGVSCLGNTTSLTFLRLMVAIDSF